MTVLKVIAAVFFLGLIYGATVEIMIEYYGLRNFIVQFRSRTEAEFDSQTWKSSTSQDGNRYPMANWLIAHEEYLKDRSSDEVLEILGEPKAGRHYQNEIEMSGNLCWVYSLARLRDYPTANYFPPFGKSLSGGIDYWYFHICFDNKNTVADKYIDFD